MSPLVDQFEIAASNLPPKSRRCRPHLAGRLDDRAATR